jgi:hypothetical protein
MVVSVGNYFANASGYTPIIDGSNNVLVGSPLTTGGNFAPVFRNHILCFGDTGGVAGNIKRLAPWFGIPPTQGALLPYAFSQVNGIALENAAELRRATHKFTVDHTAWASNTTQQAIYLELVARSRLVGLILDVTTAYSGTNITSAKIRVGTSNNDASIMQDSDVTVVHTYGLLDTDFGATSVLARANAVQGGYLSQAGWSQGQFPGVHDEHGRRQLQRDWQRQWFDGRLRHL